VAGFARKTCLPRIARNRRSRRHLDKKGYEQSTDRAYDSTSNEMNLLILHARISFHINFTDLTHPQRVNSMSTLRGHPGGRPARVDYEVRNKYKQFFIGATTGALACLLRCRRFLAKRTNNGNQAIDLRLVQGAAERWHVILTLLNLRVDFGVS